MSAPLTIVNLYGAPGVGKSTVRAGLFWLMKSRQCSVEEVTEYAKYLIYTDGLQRLHDEQLFVLAQQLHQQTILRGRYAYGITDSPLFLCPFYAPPGYLPHLTAVTHEAYRQFHNVNFLLTRDWQQTAFDAQGRRHGAADAPALELRLRRFLQEQGLPFTEIPVTPEAPWQVLAQLLSTAPAAAASA